MTTPLTSSRPFQPGTTGWSADDLDDPAIERRWYAEAAVPHYWLLNAYDRTLECLVVRRGKYHVDQRGQGDAELHPSLFPGPSLPLKRLWGD